MAADNGSFRKWDEMMPDLLGLIFKKLPLQEILMVVPSVCKSWRRAVTGPYCWQEIDIEEWCNNSRPDVIARMLQVLITRSSGSLQKLNVTRVDDDQSFPLLANNARSLQTLRMRRCEINDSMLVNTAGMFASIIALDLSYCLKIGAIGLEIIGNNCKLLANLCRVMNPTEVIGMAPQDDEALAIANTMPQLKCLEISYLLVQTPSVMEIINKCKNLEVLDVRGCWDVDLDKEFVKEFPNLTVIGPVVSSNATGWEVSNGSTGFLSWDFYVGNLDDEEEDYPEMFDDEFWEDDEDPLDGVQVWFYDAVNMVGVDDWPQSP